MTKKILTSLLLVTFVFCFSTETSAQFWKKKKKAVQKVAPRPKPRPKKGAIQPYSNVVTKDHKTDEGLFKIHKKDKTYLFEIPDSLLKREMLVVTRIAKTASGINFGGEKSGTHVLRWEKRNKQLFLKLVSHNVVADTILPIHEAVVNSNFEPIIHAFPIKALNKEDKATVIDATPLFNSDTPILDLQKNIKQSYKIIRSDPTRSYIERLSSYPKNIEIRRVKTYFSGRSVTGAITVEISNSIILLPKVPMQRRYNDERIGWFTSSQVDYGLKAQKSKKVTYIDRWRLEVKDEDLEKFKRGELVEPKKQIVYYIDRATPKEWAPYIKQGINDWQVAFEEAGFKNAIIAKDPPTKEEDPDWSPEDIRYSVVRYVASSIPNAMGPHVSDPRSGEILEADVLWFHNIMSLVRNWYFVQTAAINPNARSNEFKTEIMGRLIRMVSAHEVGHTLGLRHNMASSSAYPVDSLRSASFTQKHGVSPSIMDYARFNYVAQPEDKGVALLPKVSTYDKYAISWGYKPILGKAAKSEKPILDSWILAKAGNPLYRYVDERNITDPTTQTEDLGDNAMKASKYGIKNLKRILPRLEEWTSEKGENYSNLAKMYEELLMQFLKYLGHVSTNIGGVKIDLKTTDQEGTVYTHIDKSTQKEALQFIINELFKTPTWLLDKNIHSKTKLSGYLYLFDEMQNFTLKNILSISKMTIMIENEIINGSKAYSAVNMVRDLQKGIWTELYTGSSIDPFRRNLQREYISHMKYHLISSRPAKKSDIRSIFRGELKRLQRDVKKSLNKGNRLTRYHLQDIANEIEKILNPK